MNAVDDEFEQLRELEWAAAILGLKMQQAYKMAREGVIPVVKVGRQYRVSPSALREWIKNGGQGIEFYPERHFEANKTIKQKQIRDSERNTPYVMPVDIDVLDCPLQCLGLKNRTYNKLRSAGIDSIGELCSKSQKELLWIRMFGVDCLEDVEQKLAEHSLTLK